MEISVVISACDNRIPLFERALDTWVKQTLPKSEFELVVVDDAVREDLKQLCQKYAEAYDLNIQFIRIDKTKSRIPVKTFIPVLTNNVGFQQARGKVVVITGPETLQKEQNLEVAVTMATRKECAYGLVYKANCDSTDRIAYGWDVLKNDPFSNLLFIPGATNECVTRPPHPPAYWYFMAVAKEHVIKIGGVDERFLGGLCAEDDDFSERMGKAGITPVFEHGIVGIHQDHSREDSNDNVHIDRRWGLGKQLWRHNYDLYLQNQKAPSPIVNKGYEWGSKTLITLQEFYGKMV